MNTSALASSGTMLGYLDKQTVGAEVVSQTLDNLNNSSSSSSAMPRTKDEFNASLVTQTLDTLNSGFNATASGTADSMSQTYDFSKDVLGSYMSGKGMFANSSI